MKNDSFSKKHCCRNKQSKANCLIALERIISTLTTSKTISKIINKMWNLENYLTRLPNCKANSFIYIYIYWMLNLFNHVLALFCIKCTCILVIRCPLFRWELCKGCVWESVKKTQDVCIQRSLTTSKSPKWHTCEACRELKGHNS